MNEEDIAWTRLEAEHVIGLCCVVNEVAKCYQCKRRICKDHRRSFNPRPKYRASVSVCPECLDHLRKGYYGK